MTEIIFTYDGLQIKADATYTPEEPRNNDSPGYPAEIELENIRVCTGEQWADEDNHIVGWIIDNYMDDLEDSALAEIKNNR